MTFTTTAPGKIILFGEHAVVYGKPAIAVPVNHVQAQAMLEQTNSESGFRIVAPDLKRSYLLSEMDSSEPLAAIVRDTLAYLNQPIPNACLTVSSTIPLGRGLGSGAAISTAIARVLTQYFDQQISSHQVSSLVFNIEKLYHGTPSGIDNSVVAFAQPVYFVKGQPIKMMDVAQSLTFVIGDTGIVSPTHKVVGDLRQRWQANPSPYEDHFNDIAVLVDQAWVGIEQGVLGIWELGTLMNKNQILLEKLEVSSPELGRLITAAREAGATGAKLSGAGWGGNMIALAPAQPEAITEISQALLKAGATNIIITELQVNAMKIE